MSDQRIGTCTVCLTPVSLPYGPSVRARTRRSATRTRAGSGAPRDAERRTAGRSGGSDRERTPPRGCRSVACELAVRGAVRAGGLDAEPLDLVLLVVLEVALEPEPLRVALIGEDVRRHAVEEPPVVAHDHGAAGELQQRALQAGQGLDVQVVRGLVEQQQVATLLEGQGEVEPVPLATGQHAGGLLLVRT